MDFAVEEGGFVGLIGPNGAGKTTLVKMLTGIIAPTAGEISVMGYYPNKLENDFKRQYAVVMGQKSQLFFELTTEDTLHLFKQIYGLSDRQYQENKEYFVELFGVKELMDVQVRTLSLGERMKMELIVALLHNPIILFLDEPTIGLDAVAGKQVRKFLKEVNEERGDVYKRQEYIPETSRIYHVISDISGAFEKGSELEKVMDYLETEYGDVDCSISF